MLNLTGLPTEVLEEGIFPYLTHTDLTKMRLNRRLTDIADSVIEKRYGKCKYSSLMNLILMLDAF